MKLISSSNEKRMPMQLISRIWGIKYVLDDDADDDDDAAGDDDADGDDDDADGDDDADNDDADGDDDDVGCKQYNVQYM